MEIILDKQFADLALDYFLKTPAGNRLEQAFKTLDKIQNHIEALYDKKDDLGMLSVKAVTVLTFEILRVIGQGKSPKEITSEDWKEIANSVSASAILQDDRSYTVYVFSMYEDYIRSYAEDVRTYLSPEKADAIVLLADQLNEKTVLLNNEKITEVTYIEDCLWISLEAMIKLLASTASFANDTRVDDFAQALSSFAFEFARYTVYKKEQEVLSLIIEEQHILDDELQKKYDLFIEDLEKQTKLFSDMIDNAFAPDFKESFINSIALATASGVNDSDILKTQEDIDDFFL